MSYTKAEQRRKAKQTRNLERQERMEPDQTTDHKPGESSNMQIVVINKDNRKSMIKAKLFW